MLLCMIKQIMSSEVNASKSKMTVGGLVTIPLAFNGDIIKVGFRTPTEEKFVTLRDIWVVPPMEKVMTKIIKQNNAS